MDSSEQNNPSDNPNNPPKNIQQKKGKGRRKTANARIENETRRQVAFSKRRTGLFKKGYELGTLCGAGNTVVLNSPVGKAHSFGFPNVERVANKFLNHTNDPLNVHDPQMLAAYNEELTNLESQLEWETKYKEESMRMIKEMQDQFGIPPKLDELNYEQLNEHLKNALSFKQEYDTKQQNGTWGSNPDAAGGSNINFPLVDPFIQEPSYVAPMVPNYPNHFDIGSGRNNSNVVFTNNPGANNPNTTFFTTNTYPEFVVEPFNPTTSNLGLPFHYPPLPASGSNPMSPFNYGNPSDIGDIGSTSAEAQRGRQSRNGRGRGLN